MRCYPSILHLSMGGMNMRGDALRENIEDWQHWDVGSAAPTMWFMREPLQFAGMEERITVRS